VNEDRLTARLVSVPLVLLLLVRFFEIPTLYGISQTAPYFHDNSAATLEDVVRHYQTDAFFVRSVAPPGAPRPELILDEEIAPLVAYLKKI